MKLSWLLVGVLMNVVVDAQHLFRLELVPMFKAERVEPGKAYSLDSATIQIEKLRCYLSGLQLLHRGKVVYSEPRTAHLLDLEELLQFTIQRKKLPAFDSVRMVVGIDSVLNTSGALGGDLDPTRGMYWTWQSGYINIKMEGSCRGCNNKKNDFQLHLGGYSGAANAAVPLQFPAATDTITLALHLDRFFAGQPLQEGPDVLSPGARAVALAKSFAACIELLKP